MVFFEKKHDFFLKIYKGGNFCEKMVENDKNFLKIILSARIEFFPKKKRSESH